MSTVISVWIESVSDDLLITGVERFNSAGELSRRDHKLYMVCACRLDAVGHVAQFGQSFWLLLLGRRSDSPGVTRSTRLLPSRGNQKVRGSNPFVPV